MVLFKGYHPTPPMQSGALWYKERRSLGLYRKDFKMTEEERKQRIEKWERISDRAVLVAFVINLITLIWFMN